MRGRHWLLTTVLALACRGPSRPAARQAIFNAPHAIGPVADADHTDSATQTTSADAELSFGALEPWTIAEERDSARRIEVTGDHESIRVFVESLPPGATFDEPSRTLRFRPDFIQGGRQWTVRVTARSKTATATANLEVFVEDTVQPPELVVAQRTTEDGFERIALRQVTDQFTDSPGYAGRAFDAVVTVPSGASATRPAPVLVALHGYDATAPEDAGSSSEFRIFPHDPGNTYWWGYSENLPGGAATSGLVPEYTARRVLQLVEWVHRSYAGADPERTYIAGSSMGGAGAATIGLLHARHFCFVDASIFQPVPRNHRPARIATLSALWGAPSLALADDSGAPVWNRMDLTRALAQSPEARAQFLELHHSKDDDVIHFGAVVFRSPLTDRSLYRALQETHTGYLASWDEGAHGPPDPILGVRWWSGEFHFVTDRVTRLQRDQPFVAFSRCSADRDPGDGSSKGRRPFDEDSGYAGQAVVPGDTGWIGDIAGAHNRLLRWDSNRVVDTIDRFSIFVRAVNGAGGAPPRVGYPTTGGPLRRRAARARRPHAAPRAAVQDARRRARSMELRRRQRRAHRKRRRERHSTRGRARHDLARARADPRRVSVAQRSPARSNTAASTSPTITLTALAPKSSAR